MRGLQRKTNVVGARARRSVVTEVLLPLLYAAAGVGRGRSPLVRCY